MSIFKGQCMLQNKNLVKYHSCTVRSYLIKNGRRYPSSTLKLVTGMTSKSSKPKLYILHYLGITYLNVDKGHFFSFTNNNYNDNNYDDVDENGDIKKCLNHCLSSLNAGFDRVDKERIKAYLSPPPPPLLRLPRSPCCHR